VADPSQPRTASVAVLVCVQAVAAAFLLADAIGDIATGGWGLHLLVEGLVAAGLLVGVVLNARQLRRLLSSAARADAAVKAASGAMAELIELHCRVWRLTPAEADVARLAIKGLGADEIARVRGAAPGTVRAQLTRVYAKAGVNGRAGLVSLLIEDLLGEPIVPPPAGVPPVSPRPARPASR
jgi:DNA-binding CsgD family transcriptional regulator